MTITSTHLPSSHSLLAIDADRPNPTRSLQRHALNVGRKCGQHHFVVREMTRGRDNVVRSARAHALARQPRST
jgi:hypothetical protein